MEEKLNIRTPRPRLTFLILMIFMFFACASYWCSNYLVGPYITNLEEVQNSEGSLREDYVRIVITLFENNLGWNSEIKCFLLLGGFRLADYIKDDLVSARNLPTCAFEPVLATRIVGSTSYRSGRGSVPLWYPLEVDALLLATSEEQLALLYLEHFTNDKSLLEAAKETYGRSVNDLNRQEFLELMAVVKHGDIRVFEGVVEDGYVVGKSAEQLRREYIDEVVRGYEEVLEKSAIDVKF